ncbi:MAG: HAMP domain-containing histidine kinase [Gemmatimonadales bacterium]|nr:HAMP domain-containing histidine kinase [Gemmatimonadales bacterium]
MNLRGQILLASVLLAVMPLVLAVPVIRSGVQNHFSELDTRRVEDQMLLVRDDLDQRNSRLERALEAMANGIGQDNRFRLALGDDREDLRPYLLDYAERHMSLMNLEMLQIQDETGNILSSGHYREAFGENAPNLPRVLDNAPGGRALVTVRTPGGIALMLARSHPLTLGNQDLHLVGGVLLEEEQLATLSRDDDLAVALIWPDGWLSSSPELSARIQSLRNPELRSQELEYLLRTEGQVVRSQTLMMIDQGQPGEITLLAAHDRSFLLGLLRNLDWRIGIILLLSVGAAILMAVLQAGRLSRPLRELADRTADLDLDSLEVEFSSDRRDEVGRLTRLLGDMTERLRRDINKLKDAEHRATLGEVARQVNHDIRNGITPLRNVLRHLDEVAGDDPERLVEVFRERKSTLDGGLAYLENLAAHYSRLSPDRVPRLCRLDQVVADALAAPPSTKETRLINRVPVNLPAVEADPVSLRRILDNLIRNAIESLPEGKGTVQVTALLGTDEDLQEARILVEVDDTGVGIPPENLDLIFNDFFSTRNEGTGLGLSNVRRLATDCGARIRVTSEPDHGTTFTLSFPLPKPLDRES